MLGGDLPVEHALVLEVPVAGAKLLLGELDRVDVVAVRRAVVGAVVVRTVLVAARAVLVAAPIKRLDHRVLLAARRDRDREEQLVLDDRARQREHALALVVADLGDAQRLICLRDEARQGDARREAQQHGAAELVGAADAARPDLAARTTAVLGVVAGLEHLDGVDELLDDRRRDRTERGVGRVGAVDHVLRLGAAGASQAHASGVAAGGGREVEHGGEVTAGAADRHLPHLVHLHRGHVGAVAADLGLDLDVDAKLVVGVDGEVGAELGSGRHVHRLVHVRLAEQDLDRVLALRQVAKRVDAVRVGLHLPLALKTGALQDDERAGDLFARLRVRHDTADSHVRGRLGVVRRHGDDRRGDRGQGQGQRVTEQRAVEVHWEVLLAGTATAAGVAGVTTKPAGCQRGIT